MNLSDFARQPLGQRTVRYDESDAILYAIAVGASYDNLHLVYERDLRVLPTYASALAMWATAAAARKGGYDESKVLHIAQEVTTRAPLPRTAVIDTEAHVSDVFDKGSAALVRVVVESEYFECAYLMYVPGEGGFGGPRGTGSKLPAVDSPDITSMVSIPENAAVLYRLTGDHHPVHIDPELASRSGHSRPILHGLCTFGTAVRQAAESLQLDPAAATRISANFLAPVTPGSTLEIRAERSDASRSFKFDARAEDRLVVTGTVELDETGLLNIEAPS